MTYKQLEASREARLWIRQIFVPAVTIITGALMVPEIRETAKLKLTLEKEKLKSKVREFKK